MEKCRRMKRPQFMSKNWIYSWQWKSSRIRQQFYRSESFAMNTDTLMNGSTVKKHISLKTVFGYSATQNISFRSWFLVCQRVLPPSLPSSTSMTPSRQEIDHPTSSSSSSTSPTMTSSTVSSDSGTRAQGDLCGIDSFPVTVSSKHVERNERGDPLTKPTKNPKPNENEDHDQKRRDLYKFRHTGMAARIQRKSRGW